MFHEEIIKTLEINDTCLSCGRKFGRNPFAKTEVELGLIKRTCSCGWSMKIEKKIKGEE